MHYTDEQEIHIGRTKGIRSLTVNGEVNLKWRVSPINWVNCQNNPYTTGHHIIQATATCLIITPTPGSEYCIDETEI